MRGLVAAMCMVAAVLLLTASMSMNWLFWTGQGGDAATARVLGAISVAIDVLKASLPLVIGWSWAERRRPAAAIAAVIFVGCLGFSFCSAVGFAASSRGSAVAGRQALFSRHISAERELGEAREQLAALGDARPAAVVEEALARARQDRRWSTSNGCGDATAEASRAFCRELGTLRMELASATARERLRARAARLQSEIDGLLASGAAVEQDQQAGALARLSGFGLRQVQTSLVVLLALLVELGAAFGPFLAMLPLRGRGRLEQVSGSGVPVELQVACTRHVPGDRAPTRFVRAADGRLMIE